MHPAGVLDHAHQNFLAGIPVARIAQDNWGAEIWIERAGHHAFAVCSSAGEAVDRDAEGDAAVLEAVDGRETVLQATGVGEGGGNSSVRSGRLADGSDQRGLSDIEASGDQYLQRESVTLHGLPAISP